MSEDCATPSLGWGTGKHGDMRVVFAHSVFQEKGATVWVPPTLVAGTVQRQKGWGFNCYDTLWFLHYISTQCPWEQ